ncbi:MAG TPA: histidine kinase [Solirubrobacteraceae bacterium]|nr:histidine kinase [Solirubrobacteraceae bacterium]
MLALWKWFTQSRSRGAGLGFNDGHAPVELIVLRCFGLVWLGVVVLGTAATKPHPALHGRGLAILAATIALVAAALSTWPPNARVSARGRVAALVCVTLAAAVLVTLQPHGLWQAGPVFVGIIAAMRLPRLTGVLTLAFSLAVLMSLATIEGHAGEALSVLFTAVPWFLVMRLMREIADQHEALNASRAAEARNAVAAERGRLAREMHDVLAHSLSALALQLESTRLLARDRGVGRELTRALDQAHHIAASGLQDARRAIATARGEELPGPDRIGLLADAFEEQSGLPVAVEVEGQPRELPPDARLAVYRTAQEALTNVRRHAAAERIEVKLAYLPQSTVLVVEDHASAGTPPPAALGLTGDGYGLTGMRERAKLLGGELHAEPTDDGFRVELRLPA